MNKHILIFVVFAIAIVATGYIVFQLTLVRSNPYEANNIPLVVDLELSEKKDNFFRPGSAVAIDDAAELGNDSMNDIGNHRFVVLSAKGIVERRNPNADRWTLVEKGDEIRPDDSIKTNKDAVARLSIDEKSEVELKEKSEIRFAASALRQATITLAAGQMAVDYEQNNSVSLKITTSDGSTVAQTNGGSFSIQNVDGAVALATQQGSVELTAANDTVTVEEGQYTNVLPGHSPQRVRPIPLEVMLKVAGHSRLVKDKSYIKVQGQADSGANVRINGKPARVLADGRFSSRVSLKPGKNRIHIVSLTPWGRVEKELPLVTMTRMGEAEEADVRWGAQSPLVSP